LERFGFGIPKICILEVGNEFLENEKAFLATGLVLG
jgi:hypothetical protein